MSSTKHEIPAESWLDPRIELRSSPRGGKGLFAREPIATGETVIRWGGSSYTDEAGARAAALAGKAVMQWERQIFSVESDEEDEAFLINHGCDPNVWMHDAFTLVARRDIAPGEELLVDYALFEASEDYVARWNCHCGSALCRTRVTGRDWRLPELRVRYHGHFSPLLNERIAEAENS